MKIKSLDLVNQYNAIKSEIDSAILKTLNSGCFILGKEVEIFEQNIANYLKLNNHQAISCASGSDALLLCLMAIDIKPGDEIITTPFSFFATAGCIARLGAKVVFTDISQDFNINSEGIENKINKKTKAVISVDLYGCPCDQEKIKSICKKHGIKFISDSAQSIGSEINGKKIGTIADFTTFSFFPSKNLGCYGDGGMVICLNNKHAQKIRQLRVHGSIKKYHHRYIGINSRLDSIQAAILNAKLPYLDSWTNKRRSIAEIYDKELIKYKNPQKKQGHVYHQYTILCSNRKKLQQHLTNMGISSTVYYPQPLHLQKCFKNLGYSRGDFPMAELCSQKALSLPICESLQKDEINHIINAINRFKS